MLVARAIDGDDDAFGELFRRHSAYIARLAYRLLGNDGDVDDIVQDTFVRASDALAQIREPERVRSWLATVAVREVHQRLRKRRRWRWIARDLTSIAPVASDPAVQDRLTELYQAL